MPGPKQKVGTIPAIPSTWSPGNGGKTGIGERGLLRTTSGQMYEMGKSPAGMIVMRTAPLAQKFSSGNTLPPKEIHGVRAADALTGSRRVRPKKVAAKNLKNGRIYTVYFR